MAVLQSVRTVIGKVPTDSLRKDDSSGICRFEATLFATAGQAATVRCRPLASGSDGDTSGFPIGGEVTISGTADGTGLVSSDGFPFYSTFPRYGFEVLSITGTGASVRMKVGG